MLAHRTGLVPSGDVKLHFRQFGDKGKTPLVFVHGLSFFSYDWIEIASALATDREVVAIDMRGFGDSGWSEAKDYSVPTMANDLVAVANHFDWRQFVLFGHSMGGRSSVWCAAGNPGRVAGLVLGDFTPDNAPAGSQRTARTVAGTPDTFASVDDAMKFYGAQESRRARFEAYLKSTDGGLRVKRDTHFRDQFRRSLETGEKPALGVDLWEAISRIQCPLKVIRGSRSDLFAPESKAEYVRRNPATLVVEIEAGHNIGIDNPEAVIEETREFLDSL
jgi:esterase